MNYFVLAKGLQQGPLTEQDLRALLASGEIRGDSLVRREDMAEWCYAHDLLGTCAADLPPLPPLPKISSRPAGQPAQSTGVSVPSPNTVKTASGIAALILGILTIFNVGGCVSAERKLEAFTTGADDDEAPRLFLETLRGISQDDPLRGISGLFERKATLTEDAETSRNCAWLCLIGAAAAGTFSYAAGRASRPPRIIETRLKS